MVTAEIKISCGIGDLITYLARIPEFRRIENVEKLNIWIAGGWQNTPKYLKEILDPCFSLVETSSFQHTNTDKYFDWVPDDNPLKYKMTLPFIVPTFNHSSISIPKDWKTCVIHPITTTGSFEGENSSRYLDSHSWIAIIEEMRLLGYKIIQIGGANEGKYIPADLIDLNLSGMTTFGESIWLLEHCDFCIGTNSWCWEVSAYAGKKTICLYYTNYEKWCYIHVPEFKSPHHGIKNLLIESDKNLEKVMEYIEELDGQ